MTDQDEINIKFNLKDTHLLDKIAQSYNPVLVGEDNNKKFYFCCYVSKDLPRKYRIHAIISSQSSAGKTSIVRKVGAPFAKHIIDYTSFTSAFLKRQQGSLDGKILLLEQMEKTNEKDQVSLFDLKFLMSEGKLRVGVADRNKGKFQPTVLK